MHIVIHLIVLVAAGVVFFLLTRPAELSGDRRWKTHLSHVLLICATLGLGARLSAANDLEVIAAVGAFASMLCLGFLWLPNVSFLASQCVCNLLYGDGYARGEIRPDFREARERIKDQGWAEAVLVIEPELAKDPKDFEGLRLLAEACVQLNLFDKAQSQIEIIVNNPAATDDQRSWAKSEQARIGDRKRNVPPRIRQPGRFVSA